MRYRHFELIEGEPLYCPGRIARVDRIKKNQMIGLFDDRKQSHHPGDTPIIDLHVIWKSVTLHHLVDRMHTGTFVAQKYVTHAKNHYTAHLVSRNL